MKKCRFLMSQVKKIMIKEDLRDSYGRKLSGEETVVMAAGVSLGIYEKGPWERARFMQLYYQGKIQVRQIGSWPWGEFEVLIPEDAL